MEDNRFDDIMDFCLDDDSGIEFEKFMLDLRELDDNREIQN